MYLVVIAWVYVTLMMALAEAASPTGSILGAVITFALYGLLPLSIVIYIMGTPARKRRLRARRELAGRELAAGDPARHSAAPDAGGETAAGAQQGGVPAVRKEP